MLKAKCNGVTGTGDEDRNAASAHEAELLGAHDLLHRITTITCWANLSAVPNRSVGSF